MFCTRWNKPRTRKKKHDIRFAVRLNELLKPKGITVVAPDEINGPKWWVCICSCGREFHASGFDLLVGRNCGSDKHNTEGRMGLTAVARPGERSNEEKQTLPAPAESDDVHR
jgi:hypothetical protein